MIRSLGKVLIPFLVAAVFITGTHAKADTFINGTFTENRTLAPSGNDYIVTEDVIVPEGVTLTILPGTVIRFYSGKSIYVNKGVLKAEGTMANPILFDLFDPLGTNESNWNSIHFINCKTILDSNNQYVSGSRLENVRILKASTGILLSDSSVLLAHNLFIENGRFEGLGINMEGNSQLFITDSWVMRCNTGISLSDSSIMKAANITIDNGKHEGYGIKLQMHSKMELTESIIQKCNTGIFIDDSDNNLITNCQITNCFMGIYFAYDCVSRYNRIENNNLSYNLNVGVFVSMGQSGVQYNNICNNTINYNQIGLHIGNGGNNDAGYNCISGNYIQHNIDIGVRLSQDSDSLYNNLIENNGSGLMLYRASNNHIRNNIIKDSPYSALLLTEESDNNLIEYNNIFDNQISVKISLIEDSLHSVNNIIRYNNISGSREETFIIESGPQVAVEYNTITSLDDTATFKNRVVFDVPAYNNYWGTVDTTRIDSIISDIHDNLKWGEVLYKPFTVSPDPQVPISKPRMVVKRLINNKVVVQWLHNSEADLAGYKVYYGNPQIDINNGLDTSLVIQGIDISSTIKVTAYDTDADGSGDLFEGHESAFTYAIAGPWAGEDNSVCSGDNLFITTATAFEYQMLKWKTLGDGTFSDASSLQSYYMPGFADKANGSVDLVLTMTSLSGMHLSDTLNLKVLDYLVIDAGNDSTIIEGNQYNIAGVTAENYTQIEWTTSGDGTFNNADTLNAIYTPGSGDIETGWVKLILTISSGCGTISDDFILTIITGYDIRGTVKSALIPLEDAIVLAYNTNEEGTRAITATTTNASGEFMIANVTEGDYYIYAVPDPLLSASYIPTYYASRHKWQDAYLMTMNDDVYDVDVELHPLDHIMPAGEGSIAGTFTYEGLPTVDFMIFNSKWFEHSSGSPVVPQPGLVLPAGNHVVLLMNIDLNRILGWTLSNLDGTFSFNGLPYGAYRLWGEKAGFDNKVSEIIYITPDNSSASGVELSIDPEKKMIEASIPLVNLSDAVLYPNPCAGFFYISGRDFEGDNTVSIELFNEKGTSVIKMPVKRNSGSAFGPVLTEGLYRGIYFCIITSSSGMRKLTKIAIN
jgi:parallel beta-helix repeat protein